QQPSCLHRRLADQLVRDGWQTFAREHDWPYDVILDLQPDPWSPDLITVECGRWTIGGMIGQHRTYQLRRSARPNRVLVHDRFLPRSSYEVVSADGQCSCAAYGLRQRCEHVNVVRQLVGWNPFLVRSHHGVVPVPDYWID